MYVPQNLAGRWVTSIDRNNMDREWVEKWLKFHTTLQTSRIITAVSDRPEMFRRLEIHIFQDVTRKKTSNWLPSHPHCQLILQNVSLCGVRKNWRFRHPREKQHGFRKNSHRRTSAHSQPHTVHFLLNSDDMPVRRHSEGHDDFGVAVSLLRPNHGGGHGVNVISKEACDEDVFLASDVS